MGSTANRAYVYPDSTSDAEIWNHFKDLADDIDADVQAVLDAQKTNVATQPLTSDSSTYGATESGSLISVSPNLVSGQQYWIVVCVNVSTDVANDLSVIRVREDNATGTQVTFGQIAIPNTQAAGLTLMFATRVTALATAAKTYVVTGQRNAGTGTAHRIRAAGSHASWMRVDRVVF